MSFSEDSRIGHHLPFANVSGEANDAAFGHTGQDE